MKEIIFAVVLMFPAFVVAQFDSNTLNAASFAGPDVGTKITNAQNQCVATSPVTCTIIIDSSLAALPQGTIPKKCSICVWIDYRGPGVLISGVAPTAPGGLSASLSATGPTQAQCGTFTDNISITANPLELFGAGTEQNCAVLQPLVPATDLFTIDASSSGNTSGTAFRNFDVNCPSGTCGNIITVKGRTDQNQPNDWLSFKRIYGSQFGINTTGTAGFANGVVMTGRTIFSVFEQLRINNTRGDGWRATETGGVVGPNNANYINYSQFFGNFGYGMRWDTAGAVTLSEADVVMNTDIESNGQNTTLSPCAGALVSGVYLLGFYHSAFENNCHNSTDPNSAQARITGTTSVPYFVNFVGNDFNMTPGSAHYGIFADATRSGGVIVANRFGQGGATAPIHIAAQSLDSLWEIGVNEGMGKVDVISDGGAYTHVTAPAFGVIGDYFVLGNSGTSCTSGATFDLVNGCAQKHQVNNLALSGPAFTWTNFTNGMIGTLLFISAALDNGYTLAHNAGGAGQMFLADKKSLTLAAHEFVILRLEWDGNWYEVTRSSASHVIASGTATMPTAAISSDTCSAPVTVSAPGVATTDTISVSRSAMVTEPNGLLTLNWWPTANSVNFNYCNPTSSLQVPAAAIVNWNVVR